MRKIKLLAALTVLLAFVAGCTENQMAKGFGGTAVVELPKGEKLVTATWKEAELWYLTRPAKAGEVPETLTFAEKSSYGMIEGKVIFKEQ